MLLIAKACKLVGGAAQRAISLVASWPVRSLTSWPHGGWMETAVPAMARLRWLFGLQGGSYNACARVEVKA